MFQRLKDNWMLILGTVVVTGIGLRIFKAFKPDWTAKIGF